MAKAKTKLIEPEAIEASPALPLPEKVARHHSVSLAGPMREWVTQKKVPPVLLITGVPGVGKRSIAYYLAQWILCERSGVTEAPASETADMFGGGASAAPAEPYADPAGNPAPCGECGACLRALHGTWVDFTEIRADSEDADSKTLKVDQFRELKSQMGFGALQGSYRIILIPNADRMTHQAANSVLKLLEEPPSGWVFFLTASDPTLMLPTIRSRCQSLRLRPFDEAELDQLLEADVPAEKRRICARLAQGSWGRAVQLASEESWERRKELFRFIESPRESLNALVDWATADPTNFDLFLDQLESITSELVRWSVSPETHRWANSDASVALSAHARAVVNHFGNGGARGFWLGRAERLAEIRQQSLAPLNRKILVQDLLLPWLEATKA